MISSRAVLISSSLRPSRPACRPGLSSRLVVSPGLSVPSLRSTCRVSARSCSIGSSRLISSSRYLVLLSCRVYRYLGLPHPWRRREQANGDASGAFLYAPFSSAHYRSSCHLVLIIGAASTDVIISSSHHLIRPARLTRPHCPISSRSGGVGVCHLSSKQRRHGGHPLGSSSHPIISSHHLIPSPSWSVSPAVSSHGVSSGISSPYTGSSTEDGMKTKQASEHARTGRGPGRENG